jgi:hypothetical protein
MPLTWAFLLVRLAGFEPATRCLEDTAGRSPINATCGLMCSFSFS